jgi:hypothetical protein
MNMDEVPFDCFKTHCCVSGTSEEIDQAFKEYTARYPYMQYATRIKERTEDSAIFVRWTRKEDCIAACIHTPVAKPIGDDKEQGQNNTVFQTNHTMRA